MAKTNTRIHPDAVCPIGTGTVLTTYGSTTLTVPDYASGIMFQSLTANASYWSVDAAMDGTGQGFKISTFRELIWFNPFQLSSIYLFLHDDDSVVYQFIAPVAW